MVFCFIFICIENKQLPSNVYMYQFSAQKYAFATFIRTYTHVPDTWHRYVRVDIIILYSRVNSDRRSFCTSDDYNYIDWATIWTMTSRSAWREFCAWLFFKYYVIFLRNKYSVVALYLFISFTFNVAISTQRINYHSFTNIRYVTFYYISWHLFQWHSADFIP